MYKYMTTQNNRLTPVLSNNLVQSDGVTKTQKQTIFENMSDGIITVTADGLINYVNSAATQIFDLSEESLVGQSFAETLLSSRKNKAFNRLFKKCSKKNCPSSKETVTYTTPEGQKHLRITISLVKQSTGADSEYGMLILVEDISDAENLKQHERLCTTVCRYRDMHYTVSFRLEPHPLHLTYSTKSLLLYTNDRGNDIDLVFGDHLFYEFFSKRCRSDTAKKKYSFQYKANGNDLSFCNSRTACG